MRLVFFNQCIGHHKNFDAIKRMCAVANIEFEHTNNYERIQRDDYDILMSIMKWVDPAIIPKKIKIIYGPQFWVIPEGPIIGPRDPSLDGRAVLNCLCNWVGNYYIEFAKEFKVDHQPFPFAVDIQKFQPQIDTIKDIDILVYYKNRNKTLYENIINKLNTLNVKYHIITYGSYNENDYKNLLSRSKFMLVIDASESQGFALQEAMSMDVPLLVFDVKSMHDEYYKGTEESYAKYPDKKMLATSVPYWSDKCGIKISEITEIEAAIKFMLENYHRFDPRSYIVENLSEKPCINRILSYFGLPIIN